MPDELLHPRVGLYINGLFVPVTKLEVEQTAYNHSDTARITTYCDGSPDYGALSQEQAHIPYLVKIGTEGSTSLPDTMFNGFLDEIDTVYDQDIITLSGRGLLSLLIDERTTQRPNSNVDVGDVIRGLITGKGLKAKVDTAGVKVGKLLNDNQVTTGRNVRIMDYIAMLANGVGWQTRVVNDVVIVGPPPQQDVPTIALQHGKGGDLKLQVKHSALHAHNIHVKVVSYIPKKKAKTSSNVLTQRDLILLHGVVLPGFPKPVKPSAARGTGRQSGTATVGAKDTETENYTFNFPGIDAATCDKVAALIQEDLSRHEFIGEIEWAPTAAEVSTLCANGAETLINLSGCSQGSHNQLYHPKRITWHWDLEQGLLVNILMVNHILPQASGGLVNQ